MTRKSRKMPLEDIFNKLYSRPEQKKQDPNADGQKSNTQKRKPKQDRVNTQEDAVQPKEQMHAHSDDREDRTGKKEPKQDRADGQKEAPQDGERMQAPPDMDGEAVQEQEFVCMLHRIKEKFYTSNGHIAHVSEERPMIVALLRTIPIGKDAECTVTVDAEDTH